MGLIQEQLPSVFDKEAAAGEFEWWRRREDLTERAQNRAKRLEAGIRAAEQEREFEQRGKEIDLKMLADLQDREATREFEQRQKEIDREAVQLKEDTARQAKIKNVLANANIFWGKTINGRRIDTVAELVEVIKERISMGPEEATALAEEYAPKEPAGAVIEREKPEFKATQYNLPEGAERYETTEEGEPRLIASRPPRLKEAKPVIDFGEFVRLLETAPATPEEAAKLFEEWKRTYGKAEEDEEEIGGADPLGIR